MTCFDARQEFGEFWRGALASERREEILAHLKSCARCDHAFRLFALTAPVLHSESEPVSRRGTASAREFSLSDRPRRLVSVPRRVEAPRRLFAMCAAVTVFVAAGLAAYLSVTAPIGSLSDELGNPETMDLFSEQVSLTANDFDG